MNLQEKILEAWKRWSPELLIFAIFLGFGFWINRGVELKGLYMDDLYLWSCYGNQSFTEYVFPMGSSRFRFLFYLASWLELFFIGGHVEWMVPFNIILNAGIAYSIYRMAVSFSGGRRIISFAVGILYLSSRMAYYQIGQFYGLMESLALWAALGMLWFLYRYVNEKKTGAFLMANLLYFVVSFIHERYMVLLPLLLLAVVLGFGKGLAPETVTVEPERNSEPDRAAKPGRSRGRGQSRGAQNKKETAVRTAATEKKADSRFPKSLLFVITLFVFGAIQMIRLYTIGTLSPAGTGGTDVADTFKFTDAIGQALNQVGFVFGRNSGPLHLCIEPFADSPDRIKNLILAAEAILGVGVLAAVIGMIRARDEIVCHLKNAVLFLVFITLCIGSSSVTIRVEMRWVYVAYAAALLFFAYLSRVMGKAGILVLLYGCLIFPVETYYRDNWDNLYLWAPQSQYNSLAEKTYGTYGDDIFDKEIYIIGKDFEISDFNAETFLKVYAKDKTNVPKLQLIDSDMDLKEITDDMVILCEDPEHNAYNDVTEIVKRQRFDTPFGSYSDGWIDEHAKIVLTNGESSKLTLKCYYPGRLTGGETCKIKVNGRQMADLVFTDNTMYYEIPAAPYQRFTVEFSCNFYVKGAKEHRGEENLAMVVKVVDQ